MAVELPVLTQWDLVLRALRSVVPPKSATYVAVPMTTGRRYYDLLMSGYQEGHARVRAQIENLREAEPRIEYIRRSVSGPVIDPTQLKQIEGWTQADFHTLWASVISEFAREVVLLDGWEYSHGCAKEVVRAVAAGLPLRTERLEAVSAAELERVLERACRDLRDHRSDESLLRRCLEDLRSSFD